MGKKRSINEIQKKYDYFDHKYNEIEEEYRTAIQYQRDQLADKKDSNKQYELRQE